MKKLLLSATVVGMMCTMSSTAEADIIGGIDFPDGAVSFADEVFSYTMGANVSGIWDDPTDALGVPNYNGANAVSLGIGGELIVKFTDNSLTTSGDNTPDIHIFEVGDAIEFFNLAISTNGVSWIDLGNVLGQPTSVNIDGVAGVVAGAKIHLRAAERRGAEPVGLAVRRGGHRRDRCHLLGAAAARSRAAHPQPARRGTRGLRSRTQALPVLNLALWGCAVGAASHTLPPQ